jgi:hypothetical protein
MSESIRPTLRQTSSRYAMGESFEHTRNRSAMFGDCFDPFLLSSFSSKGIEGGPTGGGTGTGPGSGGGVGSGAAAGPASPSTSAGSGTAGVGNMLPWLYPTADFRNFDKFGSVALPAIGATAIILKFTVDNGRNGKATQLGIDYVFVTGSAAYLQGSLPAPLTFSIQANGKPFKDYEQFQFSPGAVSAPTPINGLMLKENDVITILVTNNTIVVTAGTQWLAARMLGYNFSKNLMPKILGLQ